MKLQNSPKELQYKSVVMKYANAYLQKKRKSKSEKDLEEIEKRYVIYARKSTEDEKRQIQSVTNQIEKCHEFAKQHNLNVVAVLHESVSARTSSKKRKEFNIMIEKLKKDNLYNSIISWHPDRLSRNMKDSGEILDMLDKDIILDLKFPSYTFINDAAGKMTLSILFAMAKEFSDKLSVDTKRGIEKKIKTGKYCGSDKRGYYASEKTNYYFRKDKNTFHFYLQSWKDLLAGKSQRIIQENLKKNGENISRTGLSLFFKDPFSVGIYCYGNKVVDLTTVDKKFEPMINSSDFITAQKLSNNSKTKWRSTSEFKPFRDFAECGRCGSTMTAGIVTGANDKYLFLTCSNNTCKEKSRQNNLKPISESIRGTEIVKHTINLIENGLDITIDMYDNAKELYQEKAETLIERRNKKLKVMKSNLTKHKSKSKRINKKYLKAKGIIAETLIKEYETVLNEIEEMKGDIKVLTKESHEQIYKIEAEFPPYEDFLNFFKKIVTVLKTTDDAYLIDQLVKLVFLNMTIKDKKIVGSALNEPFNTYHSLKFLIGVTCGRKLEVILHQLFHLLNYFWHTMICNDFIYR